nr:reverse transcriptase domain-containing protein [Tanacetum cinerariifolium]
MLPVTQIDTFFNGLTLRHCDTINAAAIGTFMKRPLKAEMAEINKNLMRVLQVNQQVKAVTLNCETCGGPYSFFDCLATIGNTQNVYVAGAYQGDSFQPQGNRNMLSYRLDNYLGPPGFNQNQNQNQNNQNHNFQNQNRNQGNYNPYGNNQGRNQFFQGANQGQNQPPTYQAPAYQAPVYQASVHQPYISQPQFVTTNEFTNFMMANDVILKNMQTNNTSLTNSNFELKNMFGQFMKMNTASSSGSGTLPLVERETEATKDMLHPTNNGSTKDVQPLVVLTESLILNSERVVTPIIEPVASPVSAPKPNQRPSIPYPSRLQDQKLCDKANDQREKFFQIFKDLNFNTSIADALILLPNFSPSIKSLLTNKEKLYKRALIDVFEDELTFRVGKEAITFNLDQTSRYSANYNDMTENRIDIIHMAYEEYSREVLGFSDVIVSGNPSPYYDLIVTTPSLTLTPFGNTLEDDPTSSKVDQSYLDSEGDILLLEAFLNDNPSLPPLNQGNYLPNVHKELKICEVKSDKSSIDEPPEKTALIMVLKSHKRAIAWKLSNIKGIDPEFCTHKILMEEDFELAVQHQRRVNPKIHNVIKQVVLKLLDARFIYPFSDSPWFSPVHCVPKKGTFQRCTMAIFHDTIEKTMEVFMDDFSVFENSLKCLSHLEKMLKRYEDTNLLLNWEKSHFMVKEGIVLGHKISKNEIEVDKAKIDVIAKFPHPTTVKVIDTKGAENLAADHLSRLENQHQNVLDPKEINESFPLKTLNLVSTHDNSSTPWFADFPNYHAGNSLSRECRPNRKANSSRMKPLTFSRLATIDPPRDTMAQVTQPIRVLLFNSRLKIFSGKLKSCWFGPFTISHVFPYATVELSQPDEPNFKVNGHRLKHYFREDVPKMVVPDLQTAGDHKKVQLNEHNELLDQAYENSLIYKEKTKRLHDLKIKNCVFNIDDRVFLFNC